MQNITWICLWPTIFTIFLIRKELHPFLRWRNIFAMLIAGILSILFFQSSIAEYLYIFVSSNQLCTKYIPFYDQLSTYSFLVTREEIMKGTMIAFLLILLKFLNPKISMKWIVVIVPLYICNLFSWHEAIGYFQASINSTSLARALFPIHYIFQIPMIFILFKFYKEGSMVRHFFIFCGSVCAAIAIHFLWNGCATLDNDVYKYMTANSHYTILYYTCNFIKIISTSLLTVFVIYLWANIFNNRQKNYRKNNSLLDIIEKYITKILKNKIHLLPLTSVILIISFIALGIHQYEIQEIKPLHMIGDYREVKKNKIKAYINNYHTPTKIDLTTLPLVQAINKGNVKYLKPFNYNLIPKYAYKSTEDFQICVYSQKQYLLYKGIVIGFLPPLL